MIRFTRTQVYPIGLDIGHDSIKMLQLEKVGESLAATAAARQAMPPEARTQPGLRMALAVDLVWQMFRRGGFKGRRVVACLPRDVVHVKNLRLPPMPPSELPAVVRFESRNVLPFDPDEGRVNYLSAGEVRQGTELRQEVIVMAAKNQDVNAFLESMHRCGVTVESLDVEPCALYRTVERFIRRREDEQEVYVLVEIGWQRTMVVIGKGRDISFIKVIELAGKHFQDAVGRKLGITVEEAQSLRKRLGDPVEGPEDSGRRDPVRQAALDATRSVMEELAREVSLCLRYYSVTFRGHRPSRLRLLGGEASDPQLQGLLNSAITIPVEVGRPLHSIDISRIKPAERAGMTAEWALALGLGLRAIHGTYGPRDGRPRDRTAAAEATAVPELAGVTAEAPVSVRADAGSARSEEAAHA